MPRPPSWTPERVETLKSLWAQGLTVTAIACELGGGLTRNAIIGKVYRLKLQGRSGPVSNMAQKAAIRRARKAGKRPTLPPLPRNRPAPDIQPNSVPTRAEAWFPLEGSTPVALADLERGQCKWPIGDNPILFCGCAAEGIYCPTHTALAHPRSATE